MLPVQVNNVDPEPVISGNELAFEGSDYELTLTPNDLPDSPIVRWEVDWGDGCHLLGRCIFHKLQSGPSVAYLPKEMGEKKYYYWDARKPGPFCEKYLPKRGQQKTDHQA